jgi:hypothetical protein
MSTFLPLIKNVCDRAIFVVLLVHVHLMSSNAAVDHREVSKLFNLLGVSPCTAVNRLLHRGQLSARPGSCLPLIFH